VVFILYALIFANGDPNDGPAVQAALALPGPRLVIAADGGLRLALQAGLTPDIIIGDMDSADPDTLAHATAGGAEIKAFPARKNETDLELALMEAVQRGCNTISVIGFLGDRIDQTLGNVYLLALPLLQDCNVKLVNRSQTTWLARPGETFITGQPGDTLSLLPIAGDAVGITTQGLEYSLHHESLAFGPARGMSNVLMGTEASLNFESGLLLVVHTMGRA
jgi:thiamine pyrophosphokinase